MKPRIYKGHFGWVCSGALSFSGRRGGVDSYYEPAGFGATPEAAYRDWIKDREKANVPNNLRFISVPNSEQSPKRRGWFRGLFG